MAKLRIAQEDLDRKIKVPKTLSVLKNISGTKDLQAKLQNPTARQANEILLTLDRKSKAYKFLYDEVSNQIKEEEAPTATKEVKLTMPSLMEVEDSLDDLVGLVSNLDIPKPLDTIAISNLPEYPKVPDFPAFPASFKISNLPKPQSFPTKIEVSNLPEGLDLAPLVSATEKGKQELLDGIQSLTDSVTGKDKTLKVNIVDSKGNIVDNFSPTVRTSGGVSSSGGVSIPRNLKSGRTVVVAGTATALDNSAQTAKRIDVQGLSTNTGKIRVGSGQISVVAGSENGIEVLPSDVYAFDMTSPDQIKIDGTVNGDVITWNIFS